jgi:hypothetical protein
MYKFWQSETFLVWLQYFFAGVAMIPAGVLYVVLSGTLGERRSFSLSLVVAVIAGFLAWTLAGRTLRPYFARNFSPTIVAVETSNEQSQNIYAGWAWSGTEKNALQNQPMYVRGSSILG